MINIRRKNYVPTIDRKNMLIIDWMKHEGINIELLPEMYHTKRFIDMTSIVSNRECEDFFEGTTCVGKSPGCDRCILEDDANDENRKLQAYLKKFGI